MDTQSTIFNSLETIVNNPTFKSMSGETKVSDILIFSDGKVSFIENLEQANSVSITDNAHQANTFLKRKPGVRSTALKIRLWAPLHSGALPKTCVGN